MHFFKFYSIVLPIEDTAHAATKPYYVYNGYVDKDAKFVTNKQFIKAVKYIVPNAKVTDAIDLTILFMIVLLSLMDFYFTIIIKIH
jgi:hypothetical protein